MQLVRDIQKFRRHQGSVERRHLGRIRKLRERRAIDEPIKKLPGEVVVVAPHEFSLETKHHDPVVNFIRGLRDGISSGKPICIDFRPTQLMVAGATLLFFSELHRLKEMYPRTPLRCIPPTNEKVGQVLQHLGIFGTLGYSSSIVPTSSDVVNWHKASSSTVDGPKIGTVIEAYKSLEGIKAKHVFRGATEAMMNAMNHAYIQPRSDGLPKPPEEKWWMFCRQDQERMIVAVCDLGIGIPRSLPILYADELIAAAISKASRGRVRSDARMIEAAMEIQRTRTKRQGRGKGLGDIKRIVDEVEGGQLYLFSNRGLVKYAGGAYQRRNFSTSIKGTVVLWIVPLTGDQNE